MPASSKPAGSGYRAMESTEEYRGSVTDDAASSASPGIFEAVGWNLLRATVAGPPECRVLTAARASEVSRGLARDRRKLEKLRRAAAPGRLPVPWCPAPTCGEATNSVMATKAESPITRAARTVTCRLEAQRLCSAFASTIIVLYGTTILRRRGPIHRGSL